MKSILIVLMFVGIAHAQDSDSKLLDQRRAEFTKATDDFAAKAKTMHKHCGTLLKPKPQKIKVVFANRMGENGADVPVYFTTMDICKEAVARGLKFFNTASMDYLSDVEKLGSEPGAFSSECGTTSIDICDESLIQIQK